MAWFKHPRDIRVGVIGYGGAFNMGRQHLNEAQKAGMTPAVVCEIDPKRLEVARTDFPGIQTFDDVNRMLAQAPVDLVLHITPHNLHFPLALKCLKAGKHVVTEKPFVLTTAQCDKLIAQARRSRRMVSTYHNRHWDGWIRRAVDQVVRQKVIGEVLRINAWMGGYGMPREWWRSSKPISGGILYDWGVHLLDYSLQLLPGARLTEVSGFAHDGFWAGRMPRSHPRKNDCNEDDALVIARFDTGQMLELSVSSIRSYERPGTMEIVGTRGSYTFDFSSFRLNLPQHGKDARSGKPTNMLHSGPHWDSQGYRFYQNIADHLCGRADLIITPEWARRPIHILDLANQSARAGRAMKARYA